MTSPQLLTAFESCQRHGFFSRFWERKTFTPIEAVQQAVSNALCEYHKDPGENAGECVVTIATQYGFELTDLSDVYRCVQNHASIADVVTTAFKKDEWDIPPSRTDWQSGALWHHGRLARFLPVSRWDKARERAELQGWFCAGEMAIYNEPMDLVVAVLGSMSGNRRTGHFSRALLHPHGSSLRFRRRGNVRLQGFRETWVPVHREDHQEISRERWIAQMHEDDVLSESLFVVRCPVPDHAPAIREMAKRQLERIHELKELPLRQLSTCYNSIHPCPYRFLCNASPELQPSKETGFLHLETSLPQAFGSPSALSLRSAK